MLVCVLSCTLLKKNIYLDFHWFLPSWLMFFFDLITQKVGAKFAASWIAQLPVSFSEIRARAVFWLHITHKFLVGITTSRVSYTQSTQLFSLLKSSIDRYGIDIFICKRSYAEIRSFPKRTNSTRLHGSVDILMAYWHMLSLGWRDVEADSDLPTRKAPSIGLGFPGPSDRLDSIPVVSDGCEELTFRP